jgi:undecaprenyl-diphosphatase
VEAARIARALTTDWATAVMKAVSALGGFAVSAAVTVVVALVAWRRGRRREAIALVAGMLLGSLLSPLAKDYWMRPRPLDPIVYAPGYAYPSGHAVHATVYLACAVVLVRTGHRLAIRFAAVAVGAVLMVLIGLSRVYLRTHQLSDVIGGFALGLAAFALCGAVTLVAARLPSRP